LGLAVLVGAARVDILATDVGLPGLNGRQHADAARERRPALPVLFITGYAGVALDGALPQGMEAIARPFTVDAQANRVAAMLAEGSALSSFRMLGLTYRQRVRRGLDCQGTGRPRHELRLTAAPASSHLARKGSTAIAP
jgi:CheY-like chemotaxis protein